MRPVIHRLVSVTSTQDEARRLLSIGRAKAGHVIVADEQSAGRGRFGRTWLSPSGGLYATYLVEADPLIALRSGVAIVEALDQIGVRAALKWPNDVLLGEAKLAGILVETTDALALVGIGVNLIGAPIETAVGLRDQGVSVARGDLLLAIWESLHRPMDGYDLLSTYRARCRTLGKAVRVSGVGRGKEIEGTAVDVDEAGRLGVKTETETRWISSGECHHLYNAG